MEGTRIGMVINHPLQNNKKRDCFTFVRNDEEIIKESRLANSKQLWRAGGGIVGLDGEDEIGVFVFVIHGTVML